MSEMVERVAAILWHKPAPDDPLDRMTWQEANEAGDEFVPMTRELARDVIAAMREPTEKMTDAIDLWNSKEIYQIMIDEALR